MYLIMLVGDGSLGVATLHSGFRVTSCFSLRLWKLVWFLNLAFWRPHGQWLISLPIKHFYTIACPSSKRCLKLLITKVYTCKRCLKLRSSIWFTNWGTCHSVYDSPNKTCSFTIPLELYLKINRYEVVVQVKWHRRVVVEKHLIASQARVIFFLPFFICKERKLMLCPTNYVNILLHKCDKWQL